MRAAFAGLAVLAAAVAQPALAQQSLLERGQELYGRDCVACHGPGGQGVAPGGRRGPLGRRTGGPSLVGVGARAADFYLSTGYMPLTDPGDQPTREVRLAYSDDEVEALVAFVSKRFGGPPIPEVRPERGSLSEGLRLFTENCAGCHQIVVEGGILPGAIPPPLKHSTPTQIAEAIRIGPYVMPKFDEGQLDEHEVESIVRYILEAREPEDRGGWGIAHIGPIPEGLVAWLFAGVALVLVARLIGERAK